MGNSVSRAMVGCFVSSDVPSTREHSNVLYADPQDEGLGHSFCYIRPQSPSPPGLHSAATATAATPQSGPLPIEPEDSACHGQDDCFFADSCGGGGHHSHNHSRSISQSSLDSLQSRSETTFKTISGASVSANNSTPCSIVLHEQIQTFSKVQEEKAAAFECTASFASLPLQPIPKGSMANGSTISSGPLSLAMDKGVLLSGPLERGFLSGPLERCCLSSPIDATTFDPSHFSAPLPGSYVNYIGNKRRVSGLLGAVSKPMKRVLDGATIKMRAMHPQSESGAKALHDSKSECSPARQMGEDQSLQWAQGKAGEDRVHVVLSDKHGWLFVGIYDGFNGPDAPDFLMGNLYAAIYKELQGLLWDREECLGDRFAARRGNAEEANQQLVDRNQGEGYVSKNLDHNKGMAPKVSSKKTRRGMSFPSHHHHHLRDKENHAQLSNGYDSLYREIETKLYRQDRANHSGVLKALARALEVTEKAYLDMADKALNENPELVLMGSCILVMLMKDEDVYVMNVGDSRAIIAQHQRRGGHRRRASQGEVQSYNTYIDNNGVRDLMIRADLERIIEENSPTDNLDVVETPCLNCHASPRSHLPLNALQLSKDHCTSIEEEVRRIREEHPDDELSIVNDRVKGTLKVTRAFGAGFLKQPQWNDAILEMFRINYVGSAPYINCRPTLRHYRLGENDRFLILSSDGLYQYLTNQEVVSHVEWFMENFPDGDPAQHLIEEVLFRAAKKAGMDFHQLLDVPQGDRRKYHDDVSVMVISLQGRIWRSSS